MNIIKVKDFNSMQAITVGLARNGYMVTADSVTDENYKDHWEIKYCEFSEIKEKPNNNSDFDGDYLGSMEVHNKDNTNTKYVKCEIVEPDEKLLEENEAETVQQYELLPKPRPVHTTPDIPVIPNQDASDNITDEQMTVITSVSGN